MNNIKEMGLAACILMAVSGCHNEKALAAQKDAEAQRDKAVAELTDMKSGLGKAQEELRITKTDLDKANAEIAVLKQTPRYYFDVGVQNMTGSNSSASDEVSIKAFQQVIAKFPDDSLAKTAADRIKELKARIDARERKLKAEQSKVRRLIDECQNSTKAAKAARDGSLRFNQFNDIDMNAALAGSRQAGSLDASAKKAKAQGKELLNTVPDPGGELDKLLEKCDDAE